MSISDEDKRALRYCLWDLIAAGFFAFFGAVYERFSHEVYSYFMIYAFAFPLLLGALPMLISVLRGSHKLSPLHIMLWHCGIAALTVGSAFQGALEIYGTTNRLTLFYPIIGITLCLAGLSGYVINRDSGDEEDEE